MPALRRSLKLSGMLDEPDGSPLFPKIFCSISPLLLLQDPFWKTNHLALARNVFDRSILSIAVAFVNLRIVQDRIRRRLAGSKLTEDLGILFQQRVDHLNHLASNASHHFHFSPVALRSFIVGAFLGYQAFVEPGPLAIQLNGAGHAEKEHLLHGPGPPMGQM